MSSKELGPENVFIGSPIEGLKSVAQEFDIVTASAIIEHTKDPISSVGNLCNLCKLNGINIIYKFLKLAYSQINIHWVLPIGYFLQNI
jgi:2-polyprenyl-3-methyl-5-hydroxy-6-metoxy-1,4-benzoquinol methylase